VLIGRVWCGMVCMGYVVSGLSHGKGMSTEGHKDRVQVILEWFKGTFLGLVSSSLGLPLNDFSGAFPSPPVYSLVIFSLRLGLIGSPLVGVLVFPSLLNAAV